MKAQKNVDSSGKCRLLNTNNFSARATFTFARIFYLIKVGKYKSSQLWAHLGQHMLRD